MSNGHILRMIDEIDQKIVTLLQQDARLSNAALALPLHSTLKTT